MIFNIGSINIDYVYRVPHLVTPGETLASKSLVQVLGGKGANQSVAIAKAGSAVSHVGGISHSDTWALELMSEFGVDTTQVFLSEGASGHAIIQVDDKGENSIVLFGGANQQLTSQQFEKALVNAAKDDWILVQNECNGLDDVFGLALEKNLLLAINPAPMSENITSLPLEQAKCLVLNEVEAVGVVDVDSNDVDNMVKALIERFPQSLVALTLGAAGVRLIDKSSVTTIASPVVDAIDTTGAGDTFVGYFLAGLEAGRSAQDAATVACHAAALSVTLEGATPSIPAQNDVAAFMSAKL